MESEDEVKRLKQERSALKSKVKTSAINLESAVQQGQEDEVQYVYQAVRNAFNDFTVCHLSYEEAVNADDKYEQYKTVNSLSLDNYYNEVKGIHDKALDVFVGFQAKKLQQHSALLLSKSEVMNEELDVVIAADSDITMYLLFILC